MQSFVKFRSKLSRRRQARRFSPWQSALERLEDRCLLTSSLGVAADGIVVLEPGTNASQSSIERFRFVGGDRWDTTATNGGDLVQGQPTTLTWSIAPDGTPIPGFLSEPAANSTLVSFFDMIRGAEPGGSDLTQRPWFSVFNDSFNRLGALSGLTYVYEPADDGITFSSDGSNPGMLGTRGDIRIGGHPIDGQSGSNTLAYNFFPLSGGEMVIDIDNINHFADLANGSLNARNTITHEAGHGIGVDHVESRDAAFLMEPSFNPALDGPQLDDILAYQRSMATRLEKSGGNDTFLTGTNLGTIASGVTVSRGTLGSTTAVPTNGIDFVSIDDESDVDFFSFTVTAASAITLTLTPRGTTYLEGPEGGPEATFNSAAQSDLTLQLLDTNGSTVLQTANANGIGESEAISNYALGSPGTYFVRVSGTTTDKTQLYGLNATINNVNDGPTIAAPGSQTTNEDTAKVITSLSFADVDAGSGNVTVTLSVMSGTLSLNTGGACGLTSSNITNNGGLLVTITAPLAAINTTLANAAGLTYTPNTNFNGSDLLKINIADNGNTGSGVPMSAPEATVSITVSAVNDAPSFTLAGNPPSVSEDSPGLQVVFGLASGISVGPTVDETSSQTISNFTVTAGPTTGGLTFLTAPRIDPNTGTLTYQAAANVNGTATFTVTLTDSGSNTSPNVNTSASKTFVITVTAVNDAPTIAAPGMQTTPQGTAKVISGVSFADVDAGTSNVTVTLSAPGGKLTVLGNVTSGVTTSQVSQTTVGGIQTTTITAPLAAINATLANASGLTYAPNALFFGFDSLSININDGTGGLITSNSSPLTIFVTPSNGAVVITDATPNVTYTATGNAKLRAVVVNGLLLVSVNGIAYPFYQNTGSIVTLTINGGSKNDEIKLTGLSSVKYPALMTVKINGGGGNDLIVGSDLADSIDGAQAMTRFKAGLETTRFLAAREMMPSLVRPTMIRCWEAMATTPFWAASGPTNFSAATATTCSSAAAVPTR